MRNIVGSTIISLLILGLGIGFFMLRRNHGQPALPNLGLAPAFRLIDQTGSGFDGAALAGKIWVVDCFFTQCAGPCPAMATEMLKLQQAYPDPNQFRLISISVNPGYDTPEVLSKYAKKVKADSRIWTFLTGSEEEIRPIAIDGLKLSDPEDLIFHSQKLALIDQKGRIRGYYDGAELPETEQLIKDIRRLQKEDSFFRF